VGYKSYSSRNSDILNTSQTREHPDIMRHLHPQANALGIETSRTQPAMCLEEVKIFYHKPENSIFKLGAECILLESLFLKSYPKVAVASSQRSCMILDFSP